MTLQAGRQPRQFAALVLTLAAVVAPHLSGRLHANAAVDGWLVASPMLTVNGQAGAVTAAGGTTLTVAVSGGPGFLSDWVMMVPAGSPAETWGTYVYLSGTRMRPPAGMMSASLQFAAPTAGGQFEFRFYQNDNFILLATSAVVTVTAAASPSPALRINGGSVPVTVSGGSTIMVDVSNGPGNVSDWVMMVPAGAPPQTWGRYVYLSGTRMRPATGMTVASLPFAAPTAGGQFEFRFYHNDNFILLATSAVVTVTAAASALRINGGSDPVTVIGGSTITVDVSNGPGNVSDWVMMVPAGAPAQTWGTYVYLSGTRTRPPAALTSAALPFRAPIAGGQFEFRFYHNDTFTLLATSAVVTVSPGPSAPTLRINGGLSPVTVGGGSLITVDVSNGPGNISDWVMMVPAGAPAQTWGTYVYLSGTRRAPATGMTSAAVRFEAPPGGGTFEFRFYENDNWPLLATSSIVTVTAMPQLRTTVHATGFSGLVAIVQDPVNPAVQFVVEQGGRILVVRDGAVLPTAFLDLTGAVLIGGERGLLGLAFAPDYAVSGRFFVNFTAAPGGGTVVARFRRSANPLVADASSRSDLRWSGGATTIPRPFANHNGGHLAFGPDGYLYIGLGDGGAGGDPFNLAQNPAELHGKMLRIDVNVADAHPSGYQIPATNPFVASGPPGVRPEIWSVGFRNPWRYSFDDVARGGTGALIVGDVGETTYEEVSYEPAGRGGRNYGWDLREGAHVYDSATRPAYLPLTDPIIEYTRAAGRSVTGGFVYRGTALGSEYQGRYFLADFVSGRVWSVALGIDPVSGEATALGLVDHTSQLGAAALGNVSSFGVDSDGELFILSYSSGTVLKVLPR